MCRGGGSLAKAFSLSYEELDDKICSAKAFIAAFFQIELDCRRFWGSRKETGIPYDPTYKGLMEILVDKLGAMCGFKVHWPNESESYYIRTKDKVDMVNCLFDLKNYRIELMVGLYAQRPSKFSPLVEQGNQPIYTKLSGVNAPLTWPNEHI